MKNLQNNAGKQDHDARDEHKLRGREDKRSGNIDVNKSIKEMREGGLDGDDKDNSPENDAMNYKNDREKGAYNPKNI